MATFKILDTYNLTNRGFILVGDISDNGTVSVGDFASIPQDAKTVNLQILGVEMVDKGRQNATKIGLIISTDDKDRIKDLDLKGIEIKTLKAVRGVDIQLAGSYGVGVKWWAGFMLLGIIALLTWLILIYLK